MEMFLIEPSTMADKLDYEQQLREMNEALLLSSVIQHDLTEQAQKAEAELRVKQDELQHLSENLELRVKLRTAELALANKKFKVENKRRLRIEEERVGVLRRLSTAQEKERQRIARELHDQIGQQVTALRLKLESIRSKCGDDHPLREQVDQAREYATQIDEAADFLSFELRPSGLDDLGLRAAVRNFVREWSRKHNIPAEFHTTQTPRRCLNPEININVYRIVQEALHNILKHAGAKSVSVLLEFRKENLILIIEDDGIGFDSAAEAKAARLGGGLGLIGMSERCLIVGGKLAVESEHGKGTVLIGRIPCGIAATNGNLSE